MRGLIRTCVVAIGTIAAAEYQTGIVRDTIQSARDRIVARSMHEPMGKTCERIRKAAASAFSEDEALPKKMIEDRIESQYGECVRTTIASSRRNFRG